MFKYFAAPMHGLQLGKSIPGDKGKVNRWPSPKQISDQQAKSAKLLNDLGKLADKTFDLAREADKRSANDKASTWEFADRITVQIAAWAC